MKDKKEEKETKYQYFSKWQEKWRNFSNPPTTDEGWEEEIARLKKYHYEIRMNPLF